MSPSLLGGDTPRDTAMAWGFVAVQGVLLVAIVLLPGGDAWTVPDGAVTPLKVAQVLGLVVLLVGLVNLGRSLTALPTPTPDSVLKTDGLYRWVRHPIYSGILLLTLPTAVLAASWWVLACAVGLAAWFSWKARWEEQHLRRRYPGYDAYARATPRFVPAPWRRRATAD